MGILNILASIAKERQLTVFDWGVRSTRVSLPLRALEVSSRFLLAESWILQSEPDLRAHSTAPLADRKQTVIL